MLQNRNVFSIYVAIVPNSLCISDFFPPYECILTIYVMSCSTTDEKAQNFFQ